MKKPLIKFQQQFPKASLLANDQQQLIKGGNNDFIIDYAIDGV